MKNDDIIENNKLIAEFLGWEKSEMKLFVPTVSTVYRTIEYYNGEKVVGSFTHPSSMKFHKSWDWLMPIVEKVESMKYVVTITQNICTIKASVMGDTTLITRQTGNYSTPDTKIYNTWLALIDFIKWYKENTE